MKCSQVQKRFSAFQDGELKPQEQERVSKHLESCSACRERYGEMERVWLALGDLKEILPDPGFYRQLAKRINELPESRSPAGIQWFFQFFSYPKFASAFLIVGILIGAFFGNILVKSDLFPLQQSRIAHSQAANEVFSLRVFDPIPPGTLGDKYLRLASHSEEGRR